MPFSTSSQVDQYISEVTEIFNQSQSNLNKVGEELVVEDFDQEKLSQNVETLEEIIEKEKSREAEIKKITTPPAAEELSKKLDQYYQKQHNFLIDSKDLFEYLLASEKYWNQDPAYLSKLENIQYSNLTQLANKLDDLGDKAQKDLEDLKDIETTKTTKDYHDQLIKVYKGSADFFDELAQAVRDENTEKIDLAASQLEDIASSASNAFTDLKITNSFSQYSDELNQLTQEIEEEIEKLKSSN